MSSPSQTGTQPSSGANAPGTARWLNVVITTVLGAVVIVVVAAAMPSLLHAGLHATEEPADFPPPLRGRHPTLVPRSHPPAFLFDDEPLEPHSVDEAPDSPGSRLSPNDPRVRPPGFPGASGPGFPDDDDDEHGMGLGLRGGTTRRPLVLRDRTTGSVQHEIKAGEKVSILKEDGEWVLLLHKAQDDGIVTGWARRSEMLLR